MIECSSCGREVERPTLINGMRLCGTCVLDLDEDEEIPQRKHLSGDWRDFTTAKRRRHNQIWR